MTEVSPIKKTHGSEDVAANWIRHTGLDALKSVPERAAADVLKGMEMDVTPEKV